MNTNTLPVTKSFLSAQTIARKIEEAYGLLNVRCQLLTATMRDVYLVTSAQGKNIFYIYLHHECRAAEIAAEWQFVTYLFAHKLPVAPAILDKNGEHLLAFNAPEGVRYGVLTAYVEGDHFRRKPSIGAATELGQTIAQLHLLADEMLTELHRPPNNLSRQLQQYVTTFAREFPEREEDIELLHRVMACIRPQIAALPKTSPYYGIIHGDVIRANVQVSQNDTITLLDFDLCGPGWRVYDIASFLNTLHGPNSSELKEAYLAGYQQVCPLDGFEQELIPLFKVIRQVISIGIPTAHLHHWGRANIEPWFLYGFENLARWIKEIC
ncbi:MAG: phosphotransferase [Chloroflexota bacterium]